MSMRKIITISLFIFALSVFFYLRILPIIHQTVPYTYDQGRDFLKAEEIIRYRHFTLIGPTTGIMGLFHGVWWFYFVSIIYVIFNGWPLGFYIGILAIWFLSVLLFALFLKKETNVYTAALFILITALSPYFLELSITSGNNTLTPIFILVFLYAFLSYLRDKKPIYLFLTALSLGFVAETELSFGIFLIPGFLLSAVLVKEIRTVLFKKNALFSFLGGLTIPFLPRALFEIRHNFLQTRTLLSFLTAFQQKASKPLYFAFMDRLELFKDFYQKLFYQYNGLLFQFFLFFIIFLLIVGISKLQRYQRTFIMSLLLMFISLFLFSFFYKDFFWANYYEGIQYMLLLFIIFGFYVCTKYRFTSIFGALALVIMIVLGISASVKELNSSRTKRKLLGLEKHTYVVKQIFEKNRGKEFCLRIYTPPVVPYTYDYLLSYYARIQKSSTPGNNFIDNACWYIFDNDDYQFRVENWRKEHIPAEAKREYLDYIDDVLIERWSLNNK